VATTDAVRRLIVSLLPPGAADLYDLDNSDADVYRLLDGIATFIRANVSDLLDVLRDEVNPATATDKIADWETALGLTQTALAQQGASAITLRRQQVVARLREFGASSIPNIRAALQPLMQYGPAATIEIVECDRSALSTEHTYTFGTGAIPAGGTLSKSVVVPDDAMVSLSGVTLNITLTHPVPTDLTINVTAPDATGFVYTLADYHIDSSASATAYVLRKPDATGTTSIAGTWSLLISDGGIDGGTLDACTVTVEGIGRDSLRNDGLGAAQFDWGVIVDETKVDSAVSPWTMDYGAIDAVIQRWNPAHCIGNVIRVYDGSDEAIPDDATEIPTNAIPDQCIPG